jgi:hypothetical protein
MIFPDSPLIFSPFARCSEEGELEEVEEEEKHCGRNVKKNKENIPVRNAISLGIASSKGRLERFIQAIPIHEAQYILIENWKCSTVS